MIRPRAIFVLLVAGWLVCSVVFFLLVGGVTWRTVTAFSIGYLSLSAFNAAVRTWGRDEK